MTSRPDPYERLHGSLVAAAAAQRRMPSTSMATRLWRWAKGHLVVSVLVVSVVATSTAAAVILRPPPSRSLTGAVPAGVGALPERFRMFMSPRLELGEPGWCLGVAFVRNGRRTGGIGDCQAPPGKDDHRIVEYTFQMNRGDRYALLVTDAEVAAVAAAGRLFTPVTDPTVPAGWKITATVSRGSSAPTGGSVMVTADGMAGSDANMVTLDRHGRVIPAYGRDDYPGDSFVFGRRAAPRGGICGVTLTGMGKSSWSEWAMRSPKLTGYQLNDETFLACSETQVFGTPSERASVSVLLDAKHPASDAPADLPGAHPVPGHADEVELTVVASNGSAFSPGTITATAKRAGNAWVLVQGPTRQTRQRILDRVVLRQPLV